MAGQGGQGGQNQNDPKKKNVPNLNEMILGGLKPRTGKETTKWIANLAEDGDLAEMIAAAASTQSIELAPAPSSLVGWVDKLFDSFQQFEVEFNRAVGAHSDLYVGTDRPMLTPDFLQKMQASSTVMFQGRLYTRGWTLLIRGNMMGLEGFILPSDHLIAFSGDEGRYTQFFSVTSLFDAGQMKWQCDKSLVPFGRLRSFAKQLFAGLIRVARGEATEHEPFVYIESKEQLNALKAAAQAHDPLNSLSDHHDDWSAANVFEDGDKLQHLAQSSTGYPGQFGGEFPQTETGFKGTGFPQPAPKAPAASPLPSPSTATMGFEDACALMADAIARELENLTAEGARAFQAQDLVAAQSVLARSTRLKEMKDEILSTVEAWRKKFHDAG